MSVISTYRNYLRRKFLREPGVAGVEYQWQSLAGFLPLGVAGLADWQFEPQDTLRLWVYGLSVTMAFGWIGFVTYHWISVKNRELDKQMRLNGYPKTRELDLRASRHD